MNWSNEIIVVVGVVVCLLSILIGHNAIVICNCLSANVSTALDLNFTNTCIYDFAEQRSRIRIQAFNSLLSLLFFLYK